MKQVTGYFISADNHANFTGDIFFKGKHVKEVITDTNLQIVESTVREECRALNGTDGMSGLLHEIPEEDLHTPQPVDFENYDFNQVFTEIFTEEKA